MAENVQVLCSSGSGFSEFHVKVNYDPAYARRKHPEYEGRIESVWEAKMKEGCYLFDKPKYRFYRAATSKDVNTLELHLGPTTYKDYIGTNCAPYAHELLDIGMMDSSESKDGSGHAYLAHPLGVGSLIETSDSKFVFLKRSNKCAESPGLFDLPGGHPEPEKVEHPGSKNSKKICDEIFDSAKREIEDEVNIPQVALGPFLLLGISFNKDTCYRPSLEFYTRCALSSDEVLVKYKEGTQPEKFESTEITFISCQELKEMHQKKRGAMYEKLTMSAKDALYLLSIFMSWGNQSSSGN